MLSSMVAGSRVKKMSKASRPGSTAVEAPNSPLAARWRNFTYWTWTGWSRPSASVSAARVSGVARSPRIAETVPPGRERSQKNSRRERTNTTPTIWIRRLMMNLANGGLLGAP